MFSNAQKKFQRNDMNLNEIDNNKTLFIQEQLDTSWKKIAPLWPLESIIARNPLAGFEDMPFDDAVKQTSKYFQSPDLPDEMLTVNRHSIKWLKPFFDKGQATIFMPGRDQGLYAVWKQLSVFDKALTNGQSKELLQSLPDNPIKAVEFCLEQLQIPQENIGTLFDYMLTTLPGWAGFIKYKLAWDYQYSNANSATPITFMDYMAFRLSLSLFLWPTINKHLEDFSKNQAVSDQLIFKLKSIKTLEEHYQKELVNQLKPFTTKKPTNKNTKKYDAQLVFCIDVRSEPFRRQLEQQGNFETFGFAGFFGLPISIKDFDSDRPSAACPVLLRPSHELSEELMGSSQDYVRDRRGRNILKMAKKFYQTLKYNFTTPFAVVETLGPWMGALMFLKTFFPKSAINLINLIVKAIRPDRMIKPVINKHNHDDCTHTIDLKTQAQYASGALQAMGLTNNFAPLVVFCGHGSTTQNNAYASAFDCGACAGRAGLPNAQILADILNSTNIRSILKDQGIIIPSTTWFLAAQHNTTTDELNIVCDSNLDDMQKTIFKDLQACSKTAQEQTACQRAAKMGISGGSATDIFNKVMKRSLDWTQVRPEWALAKNASFIIAPRSLTKEVNLDGRAFLHSYQWEQDESGSILESIMTAPMIVAQWINSQYLFSTFDNVAYGTGSKVTQNIAGKFAIMQGASSDLMHGLPLQSVNSDDATPYHEMVRLHPVIYAPLDRIQKTVEKYEQVKQLVKNSWIHLIAINPNDGCIYKMKPDLTWCQI